MRFPQAIFFALITGVLLAGCVRNQNETGKASYYSPKLAGRKMANGDKYQPTKFTAAHKTLPFGTKLKITNLETKKSVKVKVADRGPFAPGRVVDLSYSAADKLGMLKTGVAPVRVRVVGRKKSVK